MAVVKPERIARVAVSPTFLVDIMKHGLAAARIVKHPLPADTVFLGAFSRDGLIWLVVGSESFDPVEPDTAVPELPTPVFSKYGADPTVWLFPPGKAES